MSEPPAAADILGVYDSVGPDDAIDALEGAELVLVLRSPTRSTLTVWAVSKRAYVCRAPANSRSREDRDSGPDIEPTFYRIPGEVNLEELVRPLVEAGWLVDEYKAEVAMLNADDIGDR